MSIAPARRTIAVIALLALAAAVAFIIGNYRQDMRAAYKRISTGSRVIQTPCGLIEYAEAGTGTPLLVVHGAGGGFDQGLAFGEALAGRGFRTIAMSRFGYLRTPLPDDASPAAQADAHACLLDALGIPRAAILGASAGAPSATQFALRHPERCSALVLLVPALFVPRQGSAPSLETPAGTQFLFDTALRSDFLFWAAIRMAPDSVTRAILATPPTVVENASAEEQARVASAMQQILPIRPRRIGLLNDAAVTSSLERYPLERIETPALIISVEDDLFGTFAAARYTAEHLPNARFIGYPTGGHLWVGHHNEVIAAIAGFLQQAGARERAVIPQG